MPETKLDQKIKRIKKEAMFSIVILVLSLVLIFTWMGSISVSLPASAAAPSMAGDAYRDVGRAAQVPAAQTSSIAIVIAVIVTVTFFVVLAVALNYQKKGPA